MTLCCGSSKVMRPGSIPLKPIGVPPPYRPSRLTRTECISSLRPPRPPQPHVLSAEDALDALGYNLRGPPKYRCSRTNLPDVQEDQNEAWPAVDPSAAMTLGWKKKEERWFWKRFWKKEGARWARMRVWKRKHAPTLVPSPAEGPATADDPEWLLAVLSKATNAPRGQVKKSRATNPMHPMSPQPQSAQYQWQPRWQPLPRARL